MHPQLTPIVAQQHTADLRRAADYHRLVQAAATASRSAAPPPGAPPVTLLRRLLRRLAQTHPAA
jgi:hypothetical protein